LIALVGSERIGALLRKEKDETSPFKLFLGGFVEFYLHSSFAKSGGFLFSKTFRLRAGLSIVKTGFVKYFHGTKLKDPSMKKCWLPAIAGWLVMSLNTRAQFANAVIAYDAGTGFAAGFTNTSAALGAPTSGTGVTPFAPPFAKTQIVSIGAGGEITLQMSQAITEDSTHAYGLDFILFANEFFVNSSSGVRGLFYHSASILVQVSADDVNWFTLNPALAPSAGELYPTSGTGNPQIPVDPSLTTADFIGQNLAGVTALYNGSAGGTGYDLAWAQDINGNSADLTSADYVRIEVQSGVLDLDGVSAVPEPSSWLLAVAGTMTLVFYRRQKISN
jgi:hypothetical protein